RKDMNPSVVLGCLAVLFYVLAASATAMAQTSLERGRYLVDTVMTCQNCHTPRGPNGFELEKALSVGFIRDSCIVPNSPSLTHAANFRPGPIPGLRDALHGVGDLVVEDVGIAHGSLDVAMIERALYQFQVAGLA